MNDKDATRLLNAAIVIVAFSLFGCDTKSSTSLTTNSSVPANDGGSVQQKLSGDQIRAILNGSPEFRRAWDEKVRTEAKAYVDRFALQFPLPGIAAGVLQGCVEASLGGTYAQNAEGEWIKNVGWWVVRTPMDCPEAVCLQGTQCALSREAVATREEECRSDPMCAELAESRHEIEELRRQNERLEDRMEELEDRR